MRKPEFYPKKQREPAPPERNDLDSGRMFGSGLSTTIDGTPANGVKTHAISSNWAYEHQEEQEEEIWLLKRIIKTLLRTLWEDVNWDDTDLEDIDWEEWLDN